MEHVNALGLNDIHVFDPWTGAPQGAVLAMSTRIGADVIGMRSRLKTANGGTDMVAVLSGEHVGKMLTAGELTGPAFDLSSLVDIVAPQPSAFAYRPDARVRGTLAHHPGEASFYVWAEMHPGSGAGWVCVGARDASRLGACFDALDTAAFVIVASHVGIRERK